MRILGISGSLRSASLNAMLLRAAVDLLPPGVTPALAAGLREIPAFDDDASDDPPAAVLQLRSQVAAANGVVIATPEYNHSLPGQLKNALDWLSRPLLESPLRNKPVLVIGASTGMFGAVWAQADARKVLSAIGARTLDVEFPVPTAHEQFDADGRLVDAELESALQDALNELVAAVESRRAALV